jgi:CRP-like cAMP-binding protein
MPNSHTLTSHTIISCFNALAELTIAETNFLQSITGPSAAHPTGSELVSAGSHLDKPRLLLSGWALSAVTFPDGRRQIIGFYLPGDLIGYCSRTDARSHGSIISLTNVTTASAHDLFTTLRDLPSRYPGLGQACRSLEQQHEARLVAQIVRLGRQHARERMASLLLELYRRLDRVGLAPNKTFELPPTQEVLGDVLGLSTVHVNRTLQQLRQEGIIRASRGQVEVLDMDRLSNAAESSFWE